MRRRHSRLPTLAYRAASQMFVAPPSDSTKRSSLGIRHTPSRPRRVSQTIAQNLELGHKTAHVVTEYSNRLTSPRPWTP